MKTFKQLRSGLTEGRLAKTSAFSTAALILKIRYLNSRIQKSTDPLEQNKLLSIQAKYLAYVTGMTLAVTASDSKLLSQLSRVLGKDKKAN